MAQFSWGSLAGSSGSCFMWLALYLLLTDLCLTFPLQFWNCKTFLYIFLQLQIRILVIKLLNPLNNATNWQTIDIADIVMERKTVFSLLPQEKYPYYKNHYVPSSNEVLLQKDTSYQLSWLQNWHVYSKELQGVLCRVCKLLIKKKMALLGEILSKMLYRT